MIIQIQQNQSKNNVLNKTLSNVLTLEGTLRDETDVINPTIKFTGDITNVINCNYLYIPAFKRYYFITDIKSLNAQYFEISAHCDVLMSFKDEILENGGIILKNEKLYNTYINDGFFTVQQDQLLYLKMFPRALNNDNYILIVAGE